VDRGIATKDARTMITADSLRPHYRAFLRPDRVLLTGHSHQAWPDVARAAQLEAFDDAAAHVDHKWGKAFEAADDVRRAVATRIGCEPSEVALGASTHELVSRFL
jgi:kynureninase